MTVQPKELPSGSQLIMGLNPPFGVKAALANKFIDKALTFKPKLIILIVPKETKRLDQKKTPYDLVWGDSECLSGKAFYLPGSVDQNDKIVDGWNASTPPLYLWSRPDWTKKHRKVAEHHNHTSIGKHHHTSIEKIVGHVEEVNLLDDLPMKKEAEPSYICISRSGLEEENTLSETKISDDVPMRKQVEPTNKQKARSGKEIETIEKTMCNVSDVSLSVDCPVKKETKSGQEKSTKEANLSEKLPVKKHAEATFQQISRSVKSEKGRDKSKRSDGWARNRTSDQADSLPLEKQVEVAYEERKVIPRKEHIQQEQRDAHIEESNRRGSDMSISSPNISNAQDRSKSFSPFVPNEHLSDRRAHPDDYTSRIAKEPHVATLKNATYRSNYLANNDGYTDAFEDKNDPTYCTNAENRSRKYSPSIEEHSERYAAAPIRDVYGLQAQVDDGSFFPRRDWNTNSIERNSAADVNRNSYLGQSGDGYPQTVVPSTIDSQTYPMMHGGPSAEDYCQTSRYSLGSSGARYGQPALTSPSYGFSGSSAPRSSVMDKYTLGLLGSSAPGSSVMDKYAPEALGQSAPGSSVMDKYAPGALGQSAPGSSVMDQYAPAFAEMNYTARAVNHSTRYGRDMPADIMSLEPSQYPYRWTGFSGSRGPPHI